jgi:hypothetical protein
MPRFRVASAAEPPGSRPRADWACRNLPDPPDEATGQWFTESFQKLTQVIPAFGHRSAHTVTARRLRRRGADGERITETINGVPAHIRAARGPSDARIEYDSDSQRTVWRRRPR